MIKRTVLSLLPVLIYGTAILAGPGDTTWVKTHDQVIWSWYGNKDAWGIFPSDTMQSRKILLYYTIGCPSYGCSSWDYTTNIEIRHRTGAIDSSSAQAPGFLVDGNNPDTATFAGDTTWITYWDTTLMAMDSTPSSSMQIMIFGDTLNPYTATDSLVVWPCGYYNHLFDTAGVIIDSVLVSCDSLWVNTYSTVWTPYDIIEDIELARYITPYGGNLANSWSMTYVYDVTDYAPYLHDSTEIRAHYGGWSNGFTITLDFAFIEGIPPREVTSITQLYDGSYGYGTSTPIETYLVPKTIMTDTNMSKAMVRTYITGHGFGGNENCSEFCAKNYHLKIQGSEKVSQLVWRDDCGMNPVYPQGGTWIYNRANWCPGAKGLSYDHDVSAWVSPGVNQTFDIDFDSYTWNGSGGAPSYIIEAQLFQFKAPGFSNDASIEDIITPTDNPLELRFNPICNNPRVVLRNSGANSLNSADIYYGPAGGNKLLYHWTGNLAFMESIEVTLNSDRWFLWDGVDTNRFEVYVTNPNGQSDEYAYNDTMWSSYNPAPVYDSLIYLWLKTNNYPSETSWQLKDDLGNILYSSGTLTANTTYKDTFSLAPGCYTFHLYDSDGDGLSFWNNNDGSGYARIHKADGSNSLLWGTNPDFGSYNSVSFTVGWPMDVPTVKRKTEVNVFPNPSSGEVHVQMIYEGREDIGITVSDLLGHVLIHQNNNAAFAGDHILDLSAYPAGTYVVRCNTDQEVTVRKVIIHPN